MTDSSYVYTNCNSGCDCNCDSSSGTGGSSSNGSSTNGSGKGTGSITDPSRSGGLSHSTTTEGVLPSLSSFTTADDARQESTNWNIVNAEIAAIESLITSAISANKFQIFVTGTLMTSSTTGLPYFRVHFDEDEWLNTPYDQMNIHYQIREVKQNFVNLGYDFEIVQNKSIPNTLMFIITW